MTAVHPDERHLLAPPPVVLDLDSARLVEVRPGSSVWVVSADSGRRAIQVSATAFFLLRSAREGRPLEEIAHALSSRTSSPAALPVTVADVRRAYDEVVVALERPPSEVAATRPGSWLVVSLVPQAAVERIAGWLTPVFAAPVVLTATAGLALLPRATWGHHGPPLTAWSALVGYLLFVGLLGLHELGHAAATVRGGARPATIGFLVYLLWPCFYTDVTDSWRLDRRRRLIVDVGGVHLQLIATEILAVVAIATSWEPARVAVVLSVFSIGFTLNPFLRFDGYWLLGDALGVLDLHAAGREAWTAVRHRTPPPAERADRRRRRALASYIVVAAVVWTAVVVWSVVVVAVDVRDLPGHVDDLVHAPGRATVSHVLTTLLALILTVIAAQQLGRAAWRRRTGTRAPHRAVPSPDGTS